LSKSEGRTNALCGTLEYTAPRALLNKGHGNLVAWWALDILTSEVSVGQSPFVNEDPMGILSGKVPFPFPSAVVLRSSRG